MATRTRIYVVNGGDLTAHLVMATNKAVAINHIAKKDITARVATQEDLVSMLNSGVEIQLSGAEENLDVE